MYRRAGEVFRMPTLEKIPKHLEEAGKTAVPAPKAAQAKAGKPASVPEDAQVGKNDIGASNPVPAENVTSADMIKD
jgi:hypothetical protein